MSIKPYCDFCKKELSTFGGLFFAPPNKAGAARKYHVCRDCFKRMLRVMRKSVDEIEDILSLGPAWLNYTRKVKRKR
jgi:hypothetical protein